MRERGWGGGGGKKLLDRSSTVQIDSFEGLLLPATENKTDDPSLGASSTVPWPSRGGGGDGGGSGGGGLTATPGENVSVAIKLFHS